MANPIFSIFSGGNAQRGNVNMPGHPGNQKNDPGFMRMFGKLNEFRQSFQGDPEQMVMGALKEGRITQEQLDEVQSKATQIQNMLRSMGL